jgi:hypothetical protein
MLPAMADYAPVDSFMEFNRISSSTSQHQVPEAAHCTRGPLKPPEGWAGVLTACPKPAPDSADTCDSPCAVAAPL